jgi:hypothetical protein
MRENWPQLNKFLLFARRMKNAVFSISNAKTWLRHFSFIIAPAFGVLGIAYCLLLELGFLQTAPHTARITGLILLLLLSACLVALYVLFISMIMTWDIDRISYAVEEEAERQLLKRIAPKSLESDDQDDPGPAKVSGALDAMIARRAEFLWQQLVRSGCIDFPRANVKLAIKTIREQQPVGDSGIFDAIKTLVVSKLYARSYIPRLRLKIMDKLVFTFVREISFLFISVLTVFLATVLLWSVAIPGTFPSKPDTVNVSIFAADLTLRGAIFTLVDHLGLRLTHLAPRGDATLFVIHTLAFRLFMSLFVIATVIKLLKLMLRRKYLAP